MKKLQRPWWVWTLVALGVVLVVSLFLPVRTTVTHLSGGESDSAGEPDSE